MTEAIMTCYCDTPDHEMCWDGLVTLANPNCTCCIDTMSEQVKAVNSHDALVAALGLAYEALSGMGEQTEAASAAAYEALGQVK